MGKLLNDYKPQSPHWQNKDNGTKYNLSGITVKVKGNKAFKALSTIFGSL